MEECVNGEEEEEDMSGEDGATWVTLVTSSVLSLQLSGLVRLLLAILSSVSSLFGSVTF